MNRAPSAQLTDIVESPVAAASRPRPGGRSVFVKKSVPGHSTLVDEAYNVFCHLRNSGVPVDPEEFCARYPTIQDSLNRLIQVHQFTEAHEDLVDVDEMADWPEPGDQFAGFHLVRTLGEGAIARVFQATESAVGGRQVVLKISPHGNSEAATLGRIAHPNIVPVFSFAEEKDSGLSAVCMPYLGCATLHNVLDHVYGNPAPGQKAAAILQAAQDPAWTEPLSPPRVLQRGTYVDGIRWLAVQMADALAFIHAKGIYHRDLKPSNVLLRPDGTPMLLDFNLAADTHNPTSRQGGTPLYMSPEQLRAVDAASRIDDESRARSELFSLGVILYELLTGKHPFGPLPLKMKTHELMGFLAERQKQGFRPIRAIRPEVDGTFARIIEKCLAFDPRKRPASAAEVRQVLRRSLGLCASVTRWIVRHPKSVAAACLLAVGLGTAGAVHLATRPPEQVAQSQRGKAAFEKRDHELALHHFNESLRADPAQADILFARGRTYLKLATGDPKLYGIASADFIEADKLAPAPRNQAFIGYCLHQLASPPKAVIHVYEQALKGGINTAQIHANLAELHGAQGSPEELEKAQQHLDLALQMDPTLQLAHYVQLVVSYQKSLKPKLTPAEREIYLSKGIAHFRKALELGPMTGKMTMLGARVCASAARFDKSWTAPALEYLGKAMDQGISLNPKDPSFVALKDTDAYRALLLRTPPPNHASVASIRAVEPLTE